MQPMGNFQCPKCGKMSVVKDFRAGSLMKAGAEILHCLSCGWTQDTGRYFG